MSLNFIQHLGDEDDCTSHQTISQKNIKILQKNIFTKKTDISYYIVQKQKKKKNQEKKIVLYNFYAYIT